MRPNWTSGGRTREASAVLVFVLGLGSTIGIYFLTRHHEQQDLLLATRTAAESFRTDLITDVDYEIKGLKRLGLLANRISATEQFWTDNAEMYIQRRPGCIALEVLTSTHERASLVYASEEQRRQRPLAFAGVPTDLLKAALQTSGAIMSPFVPVPDGGTQRLTVMPFGTHDDRPGFLVAFFDARQSLDGILADVGHLGFSLAVLEGGREQYRTARGNRERRGWPDSAYSVAITFPGITWQLRVWPEAATLYAMDANIPELTLIVGSLISFLLALTVHFASSARTQSRNLRRLNSELTEEVRRRESTEEELRHARDDLEARVVQRTTELSTANAKLEREIVEHDRAEQSLQILTGQLLHLQDEERRRIARELHDGTTQNLIALGMNIASLRTQTLAAEQRAELLDDCVRLIQQSVSELRTTSHLLHPPLIDELGLPVTLRTYADGFAARSGIRVALKLDPELGRLNRDVELGIFRVVQESLANIHRHAHSETASILLCHEDGHLELEISDKGTGMPPEVLAKTERGIAGVGIAGMRERVRLLGGDFEIQSNDSGTTIRIVLPGAVAGRADEQATFAHVA